MADADIAVVTGAAGALGGDVARALHARGDRVALLDSPRAEARLGALAAELPGSLAVVADVATAAGWAEALARVHAAYGGAAVFGALVAGGWAGGKPLHEEAGDDTWRAMLASNLETVHRGLRALLPAMAAGRRGAVVVIGSRAGVDPASSAGAAAYAASKAAAIALAQASADEVKAVGVRVNAVLPSTMDTPANRRAMPGVDPASWVATASVAGVVAFLLSEAARDVSGVALPVYGRA